MRPVLIPEYIAKHLQDAQWFLQHTDGIANKIKSLAKAGAPLVSVIIPAYNEEKNILRTLASISETITEKPVEIIVVDNNSSDSTKELILKAGAEYIFEPKPGVDNARNAGLANAKGKYIINADADTVYSPYWVDAMVNPLAEDEKIACTHGKFAFIPEEGYKRISFYIYEFLGDIFKKINGSVKDKAMYVYGCSSAYRREQGLAVEGYTHPPETNEDGYLGLKLREKYGSLQQITSKKSFAWTSSRKFVADKSLTQRVKRKARELIKNNDTD